ncbi:MAG: TonB-dependent receptor [Saprospiraceae bacterium]
MKGVVYDSDGSSTLPGCNIYLEEDVTIGAVSEIDGSFILTDVPIGLQKITFSFTGFATIVKEVNISEGEAIKIEVTLGAMAFEGAEVIVTAQALGQARAINQQLNAESIANIVSADKIQELPDVNAAEAISRLPGIAINRNGGEGQKVVIRGMAPKFAAITVNGIRLPSNSSSNRSVDLSLLSPEMLDGIEVFKSPLPDMDAEAIGGTVNLSLRRAPKELKLLVKGLGGYNELNQDARDYKGVLQASKRFLDDRLGVVGQATIERFNRGGDIIDYNWSQGRTDPETGTTEILGNRLSLEDRQEIRRRLNGSVSLDYDLAAGHKLGLLGLYSRTDRNRFELNNIYDPSEPGIIYQGGIIENKLDLITGVLSGEHDFKGLVLDWSLSSSRTEGTTPYNFSMQFNDNSEAYDVSLDAAGHPRTFLNAANPNLEEAFLRENEEELTSTLEQTRTALVNLKLPFKISSNLDGYFKFGGKYFQIDRDRSVNLRSEIAYYLGGEFTQLAREQYPTPLISSASNSSLISIQNFLGNGEQIAFQLEDGTDNDFTAAINPELMRAWLVAQTDILNNDRSSIVDNYSLTETVSAGYAMLKLNWNEKLSIIPGFRYEYSDNEYNAAFSSVSGRYGVNGFVIDTTTTQQYGEFLPHLHLKWQATDWFDIRASYATTLARPDFTFITPRAQINNTSLSIRTGNPNLQHAKSRSYDLFLSAYKGGLGLLTIGGFYKDVDNIFIPRTIQLASPELAEENGWPNNSGYELASYANLEESRVYGYEVDLQTNLNFLSGIFRGFVINVNYARLFSKTQVFFLTSETTLVRPFPPVFETIYTTNTREVAMPSQAPHILNMSVGYDYKKFSARVSGSFQGTKARGYSLNKDFDQFDLGFWRWDASMKQRFGDNWSAFFNLNNFTNQQDISFIRNENFIRRIETFGITATIGAQYKL